MQNSRYTDNIERIEKYGVVLSRLQRSEIQMLREWRNAPEVNRFMGTHQQITPEAQEAWFESVRDRDDAFYFTVYDNDVPVGHVNVQHIDWNKKCGEPGIIMITDKPLAWNAIFALNDFMFDTLGFEHAEAVILRCNDRARRFNLAIGYELNPDQDDVEAQRYTLTKATYIVCRNRILRQMHFKGEHG